MITKTVTLEEKKLDSKHKYEYRTPYQSLISFNAINVIELATNIKTPKTPDYHIVKVTTPKITDKEIRIQSNVCPISNITNLFSSTP